MTRPAEPRPGLVRADVELLEVEPGRWIVRIAAPGQVLELAGGSSRPEALAVALRWIAEHEGSGL